MNDDIINQLLRKCTEIFLKIPVVKTFHGRSSLLDGILISHSLNRDEGNVATDLNLLSQQLILLENENGVNYFLVLIDNAISKVPRTALEFDLQNLKQDVQNVLHNQKTSDQFGDDCDKIGKVNAQFFPVAFNHGALHIEDRSYISRNDDKLMLDQAHQRGDTFAILGPSKMGKTSLLYRYLAECKKHEKITCLINLSELSQYFDDFSVLLTNFASLINDELDLDLTQKIEIGNPFKLRQFIEKEVLEKFNKPVVIAVDESDKVLGENYQKVFFSMFRNWHNTRAFKPIWNNLNIVLVISVSPAFLIEDGNLSPFDVAVQVELKPFTLKQTQQLNQIYDNPFSSEQLTNLWELVNGHPYLMRIIFMQMLNRYNHISDYSSLMQNIDRKDNIFYAHLNNLLKQINFGSEYRLPQAMRKILDGQHCSDNNAISRLLSMGVIRWNRDKGNVIDLTG